MQDLKQLLVEAGQELPAFLRDLGGDAEEAPTGNADDKVRSSWYTRKQEEFDEFSMNLSVCERLPISYKAMPLSSVGS